MQKTFPLLCLLLAAALVCSLALPPPFPAYRAPLISLENGFEEPDLDLFELRLIQETSFIILLGRLKNLSQSTLTNIELAAEFKDAQGRVLARPSLVLAPSVLAPGYKAGFSLVIEQDPKVDSVELKACLLRGRKLGLGGSWRELGP